MKDEGFSFIFVWGWRIYLQINISQTYENLTKYTISELARPLRFPEDIFRNGATLDSKMEAANCNIKLTNKFISVAV